MTEVILTFILPGILIVAWLITEFRASITWRIGSGLLALVVVTATIFISARIELIKESMWQAQTLQALHKIAKDGNAERIEKLLADYDKTFHVEGAEAAAVNLYLGATAKADPDPQEPLMTAIALKHLEERGIKTDLRIDPLCSVNRDGTYTAIVSLVPNYFDHHAVVSLSATGELLGITGAIKDSQRVFRPDERITFATGLAEKFLTERGIPHGTPNFGDVEKGVFTLFFHTGKNQDGGKSSDYISVILDPNLKVRSVERRVESKTTRLYPENTSPGS